MPAEDTGEAPGPAEATEQAPGPEPGAEATVPAAREGQVPGPAAAETESASKLLQQSTCVTASNLVHHGAKEDVLSGGPLLSVDLLELLLSQVLLVRVRSLCRDLGLQLVVGKALGDVVHKAIKSPSIWHWIALLHVQMNQECNTGLVCRLLQGAHSQTLQAMH